MSVLLRETLNIIATGLDQESLLPLDQHHAVSCPLHETFVNMATAQELVARAWRDAFESKEPQTDAERALWNHVLARTQNGSNSSEESSRTSSDAVAHCMTQLQRELRAKRMYCSASWGYFEAANIGALRLRRVCPARVG